MIMNQPVFKTTTKYVKFHFMENYMVVRKKFERKVPIAPVC